MSRSILEPKQAHIGDLMLPPGSLWELRFSGLLRSEQWQLFTDVSGQRIGPVFRGQQYLADETNRFSRNVCKNYHYSLRNNLEERGSHASISWVMGALFLGIKRPGLEPDRLILSTAKIMMSGSVPSVKYIPSKHAQGQLCYSYMQIVYFNI